MHNSLQLIYHLFKDMHLSKDCYLPPQDSPSHPQNPPLGQKSPLPKSHLSDSPHCFEITHNTCARVRSHKYQSPIDRIPTHALETAPTVHDPKSPNTGIENYLPMLAMVLSGQKELSPLLGAQPFPPALQKSRQCDRMRPTSPPPPTGPAHLVLGTSWLAPFAPTRMDSH